eukprot:360679_1
MEFCATCRNKRKTLRIEWIAILSLLSMVLLFMIVTLYITPYIFHVHSWCNWIINAAVIFYSWSKFLTYSFFLERLFLVSFKSAQFKSHQILISRTVIILFADSMAVMACLNGRGYYDKETDSCVPNYPPFVLLIFAVGDLIVSITASVLVTRCLFRMFIDLHESEMDTIASPTSMSSMSQDTKRENEAKHLLLKKFVVLSLNALVSSQLSLILCIVIALSSMWISLDCVINTWCILLSFKSHDNMYFRICVHSHRCIGYKCLQCWSCVCCCATSIEKAAPKSKSVKVCMDSAKNGQNENENEFAGTSTDDDETEVVDYERANHIPEPTKFDPDIDS